MHEIKEYTEKKFEDIKHIDENGNEYWSARELQKVLSYTQWRRFENTINKAKISCEKSNVNVYDHFVDIGKMVSIGSITRRETKDYRLTRYACYLIAQNGDSRKEVIALAQTYFAIQTRKQELKDKIQGESEANATHYEVGKKIRNTIVELGGTLPEDLPTRERSLKELEKVMKELEVKQ